MVEQNNVLEQLLASGITLEQLIVAGKAASDLHKAEVVKAVEGEKAKRQTVSDDITEMVAEIEMAKVWPEIEFTFVAKRTDTGLDEGTLVAKLPNSLMDEIFEAVRVAGAPELKSLKRLEVTFKAGSKGTVALQTSGVAKTAGTGGGQAGKGWLKEGGSVEKLDDIFEANASEDDKDAYKEAVAAKDGNDAYGIKTKVAKAAGYKRAK